MLAENLDPVLARMVRPTPRLALSLTGSMPGKAVLGNQTQQPAQPEGGLALVCSSSGAIHYGHRCTCSTLESCAL